MSEEFEEKMKKCGSMSGVRKVIAEHAEASRVTIEPNVAALPFAPNASLPYVIVNEAIAFDIATEVADAAAVAVDGRDPTEEASVDVAETLAFQEPPSGIVPFASFVVNDFVASIDVVAPACRSRRRRSTR
jgi:hypothetical protein